MNDHNTQLQDEESSDPYDAEALEYLDHINYENADFDDNEIDYIEQSIQSSLYRWTAESGSAGSTHNALILDVCCKGEKVEVCVTFLNV